LVEFDGMAKTNANHSGFGVAATRRMASADSLRMPLPAATWYAVKLASIMLGREDQALLDASLGIETRAALLDWSERCAEVIANECGRERADLFWDRICAALRTREAPPVFEEDSELD
jgi:hypothetical protein